MKLKDLIEKYGDYEIQEDKIDELLIKPKPKTVWDLEDDDIFYYCDNDGNSVIETEWNNLQVEHNMRKYGNVFLTRQEAEREVARRKIETELLRFGGRKEFKFGDTNYHLYVMWYQDCLSYELDIDFSEAIFYPNIIYFNSKEDIQNAINEIGEDRLIKEYFGIEEKNV